MERKPFPRSPKILSGASLQGWINEKIAVLRDEKPTMRVMMYPAAEQNPYLVVTRQHLEKLGAKVTMLDQLDSPEILKLAASNDILHVFNIKEYESPFTSPEMFQQLQKFSKRVWSLWAVKKLKLRIFWTLYNEPKGNFSSERLERFGRKWMFSKADRIVCPSNATRNLLHERYPDLPIDKLLHIPHHNFGDYFPKQVSRRGAREHLGIKPKGKVFICFGGIHPYKGLTDIIPLFSKYPLKDHTLIVAGSPSNKHYAATIEGLCSQYDNVHAFLRYIDRHDVQYYLQASDIFVMPYKDVLNSGSMMLALSFGKPLVAPRIGSIPEVLNRQCSVLFNQAGSQELQNALIKSLEMDITKASKEARRISEEYSAEVLTRKLINSYLDFFPSKQKVPDEAEEI